MCALLSAVLVIYFLLPVFCCCCCFLTGLFNIGNKVLVSIDLFLKMRSNIKLGHAPSQAARTLLDHFPNHPGKVWITLHTHEFSKCLISPFLLRLYLMNLTGSFFYCISPCTESRGVISNPRASPERLLGL